MVSRVQWSKYSIDETRDDFIKPTYEVLFLRMREAKDHLSAHVLRSRLAVRAVHLQLVSVELQLPSIFATRKEIDAWSVTVHTSSEEFQDFSVVPMSMGETVLSLSETELAKFWIRDQGENRDYLVELPTL